MTDKDDIQPRHSRSVSAGVVGGGWWDLFQAPEHVVPDRVVPERIERREGPEAGARLGGCDA